MIRLPGIRAATALVAGAGATLLAAGGLLAAYAFQAGGMPLPYAYEALKDEPAAAVQALAREAGDARPGVMALKALPQDKQVATAETLDFSDGSTLVVGWRSEIGEPVLRSDISAAEDGRLVAALRKHLPEGSTVYAMPELSRRLARLAAANYPLAAADDSAAIRLPEQWTGAREAITEAERRWRPATADAAADKRFADFVEALDLEDKYGVAHLQVMAGGKEAYLVLHVRDAFDIGVAAPDRFAVGLRDFPGAGNVHDVTKLVKQWMTEEGHAAYAVVQRDENAVRAYYLADANDKSSLLGQLLPFNSARLGLVPGATLVFQDSGYWVYRIASVQDS